MPKPSWGGAASGALGGAATGASIGSAIPGIGTAIGAGIGGVVGGVSGLFGSGKKKKKKLKQISTLDPQQKQLYEQNIAGLRGEGPFGNLYNFDQNGYNNVFDQTVSAPAYRNFQENIIPSITGQFRGNNLMNSSYAGDALSRAGRDVQQNLDAQRSANIFSGQQQANQNKQNAINNILGMQTFAIDKPEAQTPGTIDQILTSLAPEAGKWFADYLKSARNTGAPVTPAVAA